MNYKSLLLSPFGLLSVGLAPSGAADLPVKARAPVSDPYSPLWTGWYVGGHLGAIGDRSGQSSFVPALAQAPGGGYCFANNCKFNNSQTAVGLLAGIQIGYNFQSGRAVYGWESDISLSTAKKTATGPNAGLLVGALGNWTAKTGSEALGTTRFRAGYTFDRTLAYVTGGVAYVDRRDAFTPGTPVPGSGGPAAFATSTTGWRVGWTAGGGVEQLVGQNLSVKAEALYYSVGSKDHFPLDSFREGYGLNDRMTGWVARLGVNYLFH